MSDQLMAQAERALANATGRRGPRPHVPPSLADLQDDGAPVRVRDVAALAGFSKKKIMADWRNGEIALSWVRCGTRQMALVARAEAYRYLTAIGVAA